MLKLDIIFNYHMKISHAFNPIIRSSSFSFCWPLNVWCQRKNHTYLKPKPPRLFMYVWTPSTTTRDYRWKLRLIHIFCVFANLVEINLLICKANSCLVYAWIKENAENWKVKRNSKHNFDQICLSFLDLKSFSCKNPTFSRYVLQIVDKGSLQASTFVFLFWKFLAY